MANERLLQVIQNSNRQSGSWLPDTPDASCPCRVLPCGNARCADEAMHSGEQARNEGGLAQVYANRSMDNALQVARRCQTPDEACPLVQATGVNRNEALVAIQQLHAGK